MHDWVASRHEAAEVCSPEEHEYAETHLTYSTKLLHVLPKFETNILLGYPSGNVHRCAMSWNRSRESLTQQRGFGGVQGWRQNVRGSRFWAPQSDIQISCAVIWWTWSKNNMFRWRCCRTSKERGSSWCIALQPEQTML